MSPAPAQLTDHLGYWLRQLSNRVSQAFARKLADLDVTVAEWALMRALYDRPPTSPSSLADLMGLSRGAVTRLADRLIAKGYLTRAANPDDGRAQTLALSDAGTAFVPSLAALADLNEAECFGHLPTEDRAALDRILRATVARLGLMGIPVS